MTELAYIVHQIPGRVRLRIRGKRQDEAYFEELRRQLQPVDGIEHVRVNCNTGTIIVRHPEKPYADLETELRRLQLFDIAEGTEPETPALKPLISGLSKIDRLINEESAGIANLRTLVVAAAVLLAIRQFRRGELLGPALPLLWNALELVGRFNGWASDSTGESSSYGTSD
jgi:hypothetical protein